MPKLIMMSAPSASGKSTLAREMMQNDPNMVRINRDNLRSMMLNKWKPQSEGMIIESEIALAKIAAEYKRNIVIDDTNLMPNDESRWKNVATSIGYSFEKKVLKVSLEECISRDGKRADAIGPAAIERQFLRAKLWDIPSDKMVCIFDIDGTLADLEHRIPWITIGSDCPDCMQSLVWMSSCKTCAGTGKLIKKRHDQFYNLVYKDPPIDIVVDWIKACYPEFYVLIVSGRSPENGCDILTRSWLDKHKIKYDHLIMRRSNMHGPDDEEKQLILDDILKIIPKERIAFVVDDRPNVVAMWRRNGLKVIPVRGRDDDKFYTPVKE